MAVRHPLIHNRCSKTEATDDGKSRGPSSSCLEGRLELFHAMLARHYAKADDAEKTRWYLFKAADQADRLAG
jgi:hypothetical protein